MVPNPEPRYFNRVRLETVFILPRGINVHSNIIYILPLDTITFQALNKKPAI
jgi:hypothetical protein